MWEIFCDKCRGDCDDVEEIAPEWLPSAALTVARSVLRVCALAVPVLLDRRLLRQRLVLVLVPSRGGGGCATLNLVDCDQRRGSAGLLLQVHSHGIPRADSK